MRDRKVEAFFCVIGWVCVVPVVVAYAAAFVLSPFYLCMGLVCFLVCNLSLIAKTFDQHPHNLSISTDYYYYPKS